MADNVLLAQKDIGGWSKNIPYHHELSQSEQEDFLNAKVEVGATLLLLMAIDRPSKEIIASIEAAVKWFDEPALEGIRITTIPNDDGKRDRIVVEDKHLWPGEGFMTWKRKGLSFVIAMV